MNTTEAHWGIAYHSNSSSSSGRKWYYLARLVHVDGQWFELYRGDVPANSFDPRTYSGSNNREQFRDAALTAGFALLHGLFRAAPPPRRGNVMIREGV